jgi:glycosyltransferase involved in cell wall biosynthesis
MDVHRVGTRNTFQFHARRYYREHLAAQRPDVLVEDINKIPLFTPRWGGPPVVAVVPHLFGGTVFQVASLPVAAAVWLAERPIPYVYRGIPFEAISESTKEDLAERGIPAAEVRVIYCGIDTRHFTPAPEARSPRPLFTYVGRLVKYKGVDIAIRALAAMQQREATLEVAGNGDYRPELERLVKSLDLEGRVRFLGFISEAEKLALLRRSWALAFASPKEGWGITNLEAAACGTPVVASNSPGIRESVLDGETGYLVPHGDHMAMAAALDRLARSPDLVRELGDAGRRFAEGFTWERAADETERHLSETVHRGG